ncbi:hypothetical protein M409DRAFT_71238 [Zasmidium cellare ATCC 36951]|uniref:ThuA-like domain-containing protein n=1 Tax=Zasmidium cellare ATCC 36951 TaxID=1080233 RepID=A0A6A6BWC4_ZASCE|nr:uncharacterized protein M409DRAFT_71238 [Zasmidium cellare ATCC 36951]KAF2159111.1 hypothetical protein M409DRAFT_71238 [Zasmidium cellare ATCC 36951]
MSTTRPKVVQLALEKPPWHEEMEASLLEALKSTADLQEITTAAEASKLFNGNAKPVVLAIDQALSEKKHDRLRAEAVNFVKNGGTIIFGCHFPSFVTPPNIDKLFSAFSLPWQMSEYNRTEFNVNGAMEQINTSGLVPRYSQKAVQLKKVPRSDAVYLPDASSYTQSMVFPAAPIADLTLTPAAFGASGQGKVGYLGDVNAEAATTHVVLAMCGLSG